MKKQIKSTAQNSFTDTALLKEIRELIISARKAVVRNIDTIQVITNFEIGRRIFLFEQNEKIRADYGEKIIQNLSGRLTAEFGKGFSSTNLKLMRQFYMVYAPKIGQTVSDQSNKLRVASEQLTSNRKGQTLSDQFGKFPFTLSWSHYVFLLGIKDEKKNREKQKQECKQSPGRGRAWRRMNAPGLPASRRF